MDYLARASEYASRGDLDGAYDALMRRGSKMYDTGSTGGGTSQDQAYALIHKIYSQSEGAQRDYQNRLAANQKNLQEHQTQFGLETRPELAYKQFKGHTISEVDSIEIEPPARNSSPESPAVHPVNAIGGSIGDTFVPKNNSTITGVADFVKSGLESQIDATDPVKLYQQLLTEASTAKRIEALAEYYRKYVGDPSGRGAKGADSAAFQELEKAYREAMGLGQYNDETFQELKRLYELYLEDPMEDED